MTGVLILIAMAVFIALIVTRRLATPLALVALAVVIALILQVPWFATGKTPSILSKDGVISGGVLTLAATLITVIFGSWLGAVMDETGIASTLVRKAVELGGEHPYAIVLAVFFAATLIGTVVQSAPAAILVGLIGIPAMRAAGVPPVVAGSVVVLGLATGHPFQLGSWTFLAQTMKADVADVRAFVFHLFPIVVIGGLAYVFIESRVAGTVRAWAMPVTSGTAGSDETVTERGGRITNVPWYALITPLVPIALVLGTKFDIVPALIVGILYGVLTTRPRHFNGLMLRTAYKGLEMAAPPAYLFLAIGVLLAAVSLPQIVPALRPIADAVTPRGPLLFAIVFIILAPLCLYRGPLNIYGMGIAVAGVFLTLGIYPAMVVLGLFTSINQIVGVSDPTSSQTVWSAEYAGVTPEAVMKRTLPYTWAIAAAGIIMTVLVYYK